MPKAIPNKKYTAELKNSCRNSAEGKTELQRSGTPVWCSWNPNYHLGTYLPDRRARSPCH